jgi:hypothetical protein
MKIALSRRQFIWTASAAALVASLPATMWRRWKVDEARADSRTRFFTVDSKDYATLADLVDRIIPPDLPPGTLPGAKAAGVADYIDFLLGAFLSTTPFIFAGGPFSDRNPAGGQGLIDNMTQPITLTPMQSLAWRIRILGTNAVANAYPSDAARVNIVRTNNLLAGLPGIDAKGNLPGFQNQYTTGIAALRASAKAMFSGTDFPDLTPAQQDMVITAADQGFIGLVTGHTAEGMFANPEYGGNQPLDGTMPATGAEGNNRPIGWIIANFEGDRQPRGYTTFDPITQTSIEDPNHPVSTPDPGDPKYFDPKLAQMVQRVVDGMRAMQNRARR